MSANNRQVAGDHYNQREYQHWDFVCDTNLHYILGNATKYISRWRKKNGIQDLEKAKHYIEKAIERDIEPPCTIEYETLCDDFAGQLYKEDKKLFIYITQDCYKEAIECVNDMIDDYTQQAEVSASRMRQAEHDGFYKG